MEFLRINNRQNFVIKEIPVFHPKSMKYRKFWRLQKKRCIEGYWGPDDATVQMDPMEDYPERLPDTNLWRWAPPNLFFYVNFGIILHKDKDAPRTAPKKPIRPYLRDLEWEYFYHLMEARGFSGFEEDEEFTCNRDVLYIESGEMSYSEAHHSIFKDGEGTELKKFVEPRDYLRQLRDRPLGRPLFFNEASNIALLGARGGGKSYIVSVGTVLHEILFDGAKVYNQETIDNPPLAELFVGSAIASKSHTMLKKTQYAMENMPGTWAKGTSYEEPHPFYKHMAGSIIPNSKWEHRYEKKVAGKWKSVGTHSNITHGVFTVENPEAAAGGRYSIIVCEEFGLLVNALTVHGCFAKGTMVRLYNGSIKPVEKIKESDIIMGHDGTPRTIKKLFKGFNRMYRVSQSNGSSYTVNNNHKLYFEQARGTLTDGIKEPTAEDWYNDKAGKALRRHTYGLKSGQLTLGHNNPLLLDPYFLGLYVGDGIVKSCGVCYDPKTDLTTQQWLIEYYGSLGLSYNIRDIKGANHCIPRGNGNLGNNIIRNHMTTYGIVHKKDIPNDYLIASVDNRLKLLAGLIDSDGTLSKRHGSYEYVITQTNRHKLVGKIIFLARSLGFRVSVCTHEETRTKYLSERKQITITGDIHTIPCRLERKQAPDINKQYVRSTVRTKHSIEQLGYDHYWGFELNEDHRFLLADNTIVCNSNDAAQMTDGTDKYGTSIYIGTGGNMEKIVEAEILFRDPHGFHMLAFQDMWENSGPIGWFIPAYYMDGKYKDHNGNTDVERARQHYENRRVSKKKAKSPKALEAEMVNYPLNPSEMFMTRTDSKFPVADLKYTYGRLLGDKKILDATFKGKFSLEEGKPVWINDQDLRPIREYPYHGNEDMEGCIEIFEPPTRGNDGIVPPGIYIASLDPVDDDDNQDKTRSLQSGFVMHLLTGRIVAEYTGRTRLVKDFYEQFRRLLMYYNAKCMYENQKKGFYQHMYNAVSVHLLAETPEILLERDLVKKLGGAGNKAFGIHASAPINSYGIDLQVAWMDEDAYGKDDGTKNWAVIKSPGYLKECILYNGELNADRVRSMGMLMIYREERLKFSRRDSHKKDTKKDLSEDKFFTRNWNNRHVRHAPSGTHPVIANMLP